MKSLLIVGAAVAGAYVVVQLTRQAQLPAPVNPQIQYYPIQTTPPGTDTNAGYWALASTGLQTIGSVLGNVFGQGGSYSSGGSYGSGGGYDSGAGTQGWTGINESEWNG